MKRTLFVKLFIGFFLVAFVLTTYILAFSFRTIERYFLGNAEDELGHFASSLQLAVSPLLEAKAYSELDALAKRVGGETGRRITVIDPSGKVLADSMADPATMENHADRPEVQQALWGREGSSTRFSATIREEMLYVGVPVPRKADGGTAGVLRVSVLIRDLRALLRGIKLRIFTISVVIVVLSLAGAWLFSSSLLGPIRQLTSAAGRAARGDFEGRVFLKRGGELKLLADTYNQMADRIRQYVAELAGQSEELRAIMGAMQPGLLVLDGEGAIRMCNGSAEVLLHTRELTGRRYWEVMGSPEIFALIKEVRGQASGSPGAPEAPTEPGSAGPPSASCEALMNGSCYRVSAARIESLNETVLILSDITDLKNLERIKRDFVMNVSHELRTPLTAIKGYAETIEGIGGENEKHVEVIKRHTERLINVVEDLLALSELEERGTSLEKKRVRLEEVVSRVFKVFEERIERKGLKADLDFAGPLPPVDGDPLKLEQVFFNLIDNAVKYTERGRIAISLKREGGDLTAVVRDTGIGISSEHLPRVFERFYTVDKSRSKKLGGTGLGLSIVKHIVLLHGGTIGVESSPGEGTAFTLRFPAAGGGQG